MFAKVQNISEYLPANTDCVVLTETGRPERQANLLVVDDNIENIRTLSRILTKHGYKVRKAMNGLLALETISVERPDLILLDIKMPDMDGYAVCSALKASSQTRDIPIIFLSALDNATDKVKAFQAGGADYITKPYQTQEVLVRINYQLTIQQQRQQLHNYNQRLHEHNRRLHQEIRERQQAEAETKLLLATIQAVSQASDCEHALYAILCKVLQGIAWDYGEAWILSKDSTKLQLSRTCYDSDDIGLSKFHKARFKSTPPPNATLAGRIWQSLQPIWIENLAQIQPPLFLQAEAGIAAGLKAAFGIPILVNQEVLAVLVFFKRDQISYDSKIVQLVNATAMQLGELMQRKRAEELLKQANQELQRLVNLDGLTQVANRRCFDESLSREWWRSLREETPLALILCDIDYFKRYNDCYGHQAGDDCLKKLAQVLARNTKRSTDLVARYGGEEFVIILPNTEIDGAIYIAQQIQQDIMNLAIAHDSSPISKFLTLSMGLACVVPREGNSPANLIAQADKALYTAKAEGRNTYCIS